MFRYSLTMSKVTEEQLTKLYYSIGEVAKMFNVNTSLIRFWEKEFPSIKLKKNKKGNRLFTPKDVLKINQIYILVKENGYTLEGAKKAMNNHKSTNIPAIGSKNSEVLDRLEELKSKLLQLKS